MDLIDTKKDGFYVNVSLAGTQAATAGNYGIFFQPTRTCEIKEIRIRHAVAGTDGGAVTVNLEVINNGSALDSGSTILKTAYNLKGTINTQTVYKGIALLQNVKIDPGQALALKDSGTLTSVGGLSVSIYYKYSRNGEYR